MNRGHRGNNDDVGDEDDDDEGDGNDGFAYGDASVDDDMTMRISRMKSSMRLPFPQLDLGDR